MTMPKKQLDIMHRRYRAYRSAAEGSAECKKLRSALLGSDTAGESFSSSFCACDIETDWIEHIEAALPFIERAIHENRQFIMRQGETLPIEKIRRVSKASVEHLARHSELITREPQNGGDIIPEKLYMTENISTYAVYENRFLYMLLCFVKDFTDIKYARIADIVRSFSTELEYEKNIAEKDKKISFSLKFKETSSGGASEIDSDASDALYRMRAITASVDTLLKTNLMIEVSSAPMLKPPISRTNVLLQNPCFAAAVELYDYLNAYTGDGFTVKDLGQEKGGLSSAAREDCAELVALTSYLAYANGGLYELLEDRYNEDERERIREEKRLRDERLAELKERMSSVAPETLEYIFALEEKCRENDAEILKLTEGHELTLIANQKLAEAEKIRSDAENELGRLRGEISALEFERSSETRKHRTEIEEAQKKVSELRAELDELNERFREEYSALAEKYHLASARLRARDGENDEDFTSKEDFARLEAEYLAFKSFFDKQWSLAKKRIRREGLRKGGNP